ncbi:hypothetical protein FH972_026201 [Carpinus fangiana]|uniref:Nucleolar protein 9 n=1 Tax=Carpinus fangiana TaxID=176857 RepID=A0A5N6L3T3_9ROSI|nr:hypothetical protein FH972_026201 [Carpinus fangiana]
MPRENKKRGRRADAQKRKADTQGLVEDEHNLKKRRISVDESVPGENNFDGANFAAPPPDIEFYGLLDEDEQEYFRRADDMLEVNNFQDSEERTLFLENLHKEAAGKELKLACSQSSSRLLERLILLSTPAQLKNIFQKLNGQFASHALRVLLVVLSGLPLQPTRNSLLRSRAKENIDVSGRETQDQSKRQVPASFTEALQRLITNSVASLDTTALRALALHQIGNPTLQLLVRLELTQFGKQKAKDETSVLHKLLPDESLSEGSESGIFINGLVYDPVGSRLLETIIEYAPGKMFKAIYRQFFRERIASLARNEIAGYVVCKILERLGSEDLANATQAIIPLIPSLAERGRTTVIKTLVERSTKRGIETKGLMGAVGQAYEDENGNFSLVKLLQFQQGTDAKPSPNAPQPQHTAAQTHASVLAQTFLANPGPPADLIYGALISLTTETCLALARSPIYSHILQQAFTNPAAPIVARRKLITRLQSHMAPLANHPSGSHLVDAIWSGTHGLAFMRERVAEELAEAESQLRDSPSGRKVWRNWKMDLYQRRRGEWVRQTREEAGNDGFVSFPDGVSGGGNVKSNSDGAMTMADVSHTAGNRMRRVDKEAASKGKTALQLAREKFAKNKAAGIERGSGSGANGMAIAGARKYSMARV